MSTGNGNNNASSHLFVGDFIKDKPFLCFRSQDSVCEIIQKMRENHTYAVAITEHEQLVGLLTGQDILTRASSWRTQSAPSMESIAKAFNVMKAGDVIIRNPVTVDQETPIDDALRIMNENGTHYLPVIKVNRPIGILNIIDVVKYMEEKARHDAEAKDEILSYLMHHENYGCVSSD